MDKFKFRIVYPYSSKKIHFVNSKKEGFTVCFDEYKKSNEFGKHDSMKIIDMTSQHIYILKLKNKLQQEPEKSIGIESIIPILKNLENKIDKLEEKINTIEYKPKEQHLPENISQNLQVQHIKPDDKLCIIS